MPLSGKSIPEDSTKGTRTTGPNAEARLAIRTARMKAKTARNLLTSSGVQPDEAISLLLTAWRIVQKTIHTLKKEEAGTRAGGRRSGKDHGAVIARLEATAGNHIAALDAAHRCYMSQRPSEMSRRALMTSVSDINSALKSVSKQRLLHLGTPLERFFQGFRVAMAVAGSAALVAVLSVGLYFAFTTPAHDEGLTAYYFTRNNFTGHGFPVIDHEINFKWGIKRPLHGIPRDNFSIRWEGCVLVDEGVDTVIAAGADDGIRVIVDGRTVIEDWKPHPFRIRKAKHKLAPGIHPIKVEYWDRKGPAQAFLGWSINNAQPVPIPHAKLAPKVLVLGGNAFNRNCPAKFTPKK